MRSAIRFLLLIALLTAAVWARPRLIRMTATAYSTDGIQKAGTVAQEGTAAADPTILPLGSRVRVHGRNRYIGEFVITDTGASIKGNRIDIYFNDPAQAKKFGRRSVRVEVLETGKGPESAKEQVNEGLTPPVKPVTP